MNSSPLPPEQPALVHSPAANSLDADLDRELSALESVGRMRSTQAYSGPDRLHPRNAVDRPLVAFCSNDYLGLACHPALAAAVRRALEASAAGSGASRLVNGESPEHLVLERQLAIFLGHPAALLFPTGYLTNLGVITALAGRDDLIVSDAANHASIIDGCRLSRARVEIYAHGDAAAASTALATGGAFRRRLLITESIFSMDGDRAPLARLASAAAEAGALLLVDEAHALGVAGPGGRGLCAAVGVQPDVLMGTLGKAFGTLGGFAAGSAILRRYLINRSRPFIYSTGPSPILAAASTVAVEIAASPEGERLRTRARTTATRIREALAARGIAAPGEDLIIPLIVGGDRDALAFSERLGKRSLLVPAIRPPTVAPGTARLRITASAAHTDQDVDLLLAALREAAP